MSERPLAYARTISPSPDRRDPRTHSANIAIEKQNQTYRWDNEDAGLGCMTVQTVSVPIGFNISCPIDALTNLPIVAHSLLDDGDVEPNPGPINLNQYPREPTQEALWIQWFKQHWGDKRDGNDGWMAQYKLKFPNTFETQGILYRDRVAILNPMSRVLASQNRRPSRSSGLRFTPEKEQAPQSMYVKPPAALHHLDDRIWWWDNTP